MPFGLDQVHSYLIETGDGWVMIDSGFPTRQGLGLLEQEVTRICGDAERIKAVIVTHWHPDHSGLAGWLEEHGAEIILHRLDWESLDRMRAENPFEDAVYADHPIRHIAETINFSWEDMRHLREVDVPIENPRLVDGDAEIEIGGRRLKLIWTPGHTEGHLCVLDTDTNVLFSGDHVLGRITPHIGLWHDTTTSALHEYERSLRVVAGLAPARALPAHESEVDDVAARVEELLDHHQQRREMVLNSLSDSPKTAPDVVGEVFRPLDEPVQKFLAMSETLAHLEALVVEGLVEPVAGEAPAYRLK